MLLPYADGVIKACSLVVLVVGLLAGGAWAQKVPAPLNQYLELNKALDGEVFIVLPPKDIEKYVTKVRESASKDPEWFKEFSADATPGVPLPFHEKLGLSKKEYQDYRKLWRDREFKVLEKIRLRLEKDGERYLIRIAGRKGSKIELLRFDPKKKVFVSPNGTLEQIKDIDADPDSILGGWTGQEWKYFEKTSLGATKENFAIGKTKDGKYGMIVYRLQDVSSTGRPLFDDSVVIRFAPLPKKG